jgi:alpha-L-glutamate ligase-like protein/uncharacterized protein (TIGR02421 family)
MNFFKRAHSILGINARNLHYIAKYNTATNKKFADDKIFTKNFLQSRGIGVAKLFQTVKNYRELTPEFFATLPDSFVIKPNRGFAGAGIMVIVSKKGKHWITSSGKKFDEEFLYRHCGEILDGKYSISGISDTVIFEERLDAHPDFRKLTELGLPDVRIVAFNNVPVMAMLRVPTHESEGKANMELGAIALGIDIGTGKTTGGAYYSNFVRKMPNGFPTDGFQVPFWNEILEAAAKIQNVSKIGFVGVDIVVTKTGIKVLEINARSGLKIQIANRVPLKKRLEKVADLKVLTPEDGVEIAKTLFSQTSKSQEEETPAKPIIGAIEMVVLNLEKPETVVAKIDLSSDTNKVSSRFYSGSILDITIQNKRIKLPVEKVEMEGVDLILAGKFLTDFYIDPNKVADKKMPEIVKAQLDEKMITNIDEKICEIDEQIKLLSYINPRNLAEQKQLFLSNPEFSPRFFYRECDLDLEQMKRDLKRIPDVDHALYPLFERKIAEVEHKINLVQSVGTKDFVSASRDMFGAVGEPTYKAAVKFIQTHRETFKEDTSPEFDTKTTDQKLKDFLRIHKLSHWKIKILENTVSDIQVTKKHMILLRKGAKFQENRLKALFVHEIGTHVFRFENGKLQPFRILERGTAGYLQTEEGLAVWNQNQLGFDLGEKFFTPAYQIIAIHLAKKMSFQDLFHYLKDTYEITDELAWKLCVKSKRGLRDTQEKGAFTKDALYFKGLLEVEKFVEKGGKIEDLYIGKIAIGDLKFISKMEDVKPAKFLL